MTTPSVSAATAPGMPVAMVKAKLVPATTAPPTATTATTAAATPTATATRQAAENFESYFLSQSLESMFAGVDTNSVFGGGQAETVYRSMLLQQYGKVAASSGGFGIADAVQREMLHAQETGGHGR